MKKIFSLFIIFFILSTGSLNSKTLPPGSPNAVKANILIMLDRTFSMTAPAGTFGKTFSMRTPYAAVYDPVADSYWVSEAFEDGISRWNADPSPTVNEQLDHSIYSITRNTNIACPSTKRTYTLSKDPSQLETWNGLVYSVHLDSGDNSFGIVRVFDPRIAERVAESTATDPDDSSLYCTGLISSFDMKSSRVAIDIQDDILYAMGGGYHNVSDNSYLSGGKHFFFMRDLTKTTNGNWVDDGTSRACPTNTPGYKWAGNGRTDGRMKPGDLQRASKLLTAITADSNNEYLYVTNQSGKIYSFKLDNISGNICLKPTSQRTAVFENPCGVTYGLVTDPDDASILYSTGYYTNQICRMKLSNGNIVSNSNINLNIGVGDASRPQSQSNDTLYLMNPRSIKFDRKINNEQNLIISNGGRLEVLIVNKDLKFMKAFGQEGVSRLTGAMESIKAVVTDSTLTEGANFGLALWSKGTNSKYIGWNNAKDHSSYCDEQNCMPVKVSADGAAKIYNYLKKPPSLYESTQANAFSKMATDYFNHADSPRDPSISCQKNYIIVIGDGGWTIGHDEAKNHLRTLANSKNVETIMIAYGDTIDPAAIYKFDQMAAAGAMADGMNYPNAFRALDAQDLKTQLRTIVASITSENLSYTAPAIAGSVDDGGKVYQMQFDYYPNKEWEGSLKRSAINGPQVDTNYEWEAADQMPSPDTRQIWTSLDVLNNDLKNFNDANSDKINLNLFTLTGNAVPDYHNDSGNINGSGRCGLSGANRPIVEDGDADDAKGLINFIKGQDYFDYDGDCDLAETRDHYLADIYNSQVIVVGPPNADTAYLNKNQEAYFRNKNNYESFASNVKHSQRTKVIYAGANNGILHAFDANNGKEIWGFVPPLLAAKLPTMINSGLNKSSGGGSVPIFGVDGSPVVHDVFMKKPGGTTKEWLSILMVPYGRGGAGFSVLDVTDPDNPEHLYSILNDRAGGYVYRSDHNGVIYPYNYGGQSFDINDFKEIVTVQNNYRNNNNIQDNCSASASPTGACFTGNKITLTNVNNYSNSSDLKIFVNGDDVTNRSNIYKIPNTNNLQIDLPTSISYSAKPQSSVINSTVNVSIINPIQTAGVEYDYRFLGETWSNPRIFRLPNDGAGDTNIDNDLYVAVFGGGYGSNIAGVGSNVMVVNLENGKLIRQIDIPDFAGNNIANSVPATPIVLTADLVVDANFTGALVYVNDLEGKITKINLTNMVDDRAQTGSPQIISMFDTNIIFSAESSHENGRYMYHSMEAAIGNDTKNLWLFTGTGDYRNLNDLDLADKYKVDNIMLGIKDEYFPNYKNKTVTLSTNMSSLTATTTIDDLDQCENTSGDFTGARCPDNAKRGWYALLDAQEGIPGTPTRPQRKVTAEPTISGGKVYFSIFKPSPTDPCAEGIAFICTLDDECGTNNLPLLGTNVSYTNEKCFYVGQGVLSKPIINSGIIYSAIAGESIIGNEDLVILPSAGIDPSTYRINWREN